MPDASPKPFDLHDFTPYLFARVGSLMELSFTPHLKEAGLTIDTWRVLMVLHFNGPMTLIDLSRITGIKTSTLSRLVGRMIEQALVSRRRSDTDSRTVDVRLRKKGEDLFRRLWPTASGLESRVTADFAPEAMARLKAQLRAIEAILLRHIEGQGSAAEGDR